MLLRLWQSPPLQTHGSMGAHSRQAAHQGMCRDLRRACTGERASGLYVRLSSLRGSPYLTPFAGYSKALRSFQCSCQLDSRVEPTLRPGRGHGAAGPNVFPSHGHSSFGKEASAPQCLAYGHLFPPNISLST